MELDTLPLLAFAALLYRRTTHKRSISDARNYQYSPSQHSHRLAADGTKQFRTPDEVVWGKVKGNHVSTVGEGSATIQSRYAETSEFNVKHESSISQESTLDIYYQQSRAVTVAEGNGDIIVYIHGGYWQALDKKSSCWHAERFLQSDNCSAFVAIGYDLCPTVSFPTLVQQVKSGVAHVLRTFPKHRIHVVGHSAGGHLGAEVLLTDWAKEYHIATHKPVGYCLVSGVYDLRPICKSYVNDACQMSMAEALEFSPQLRSMNALKTLVGRRSTTSGGRDATPLRIIVAVGEHDSPAFRQQSQDFYKLLKENTSAVMTYVEMSGEDHFTSIERLDDKTYVLSESIRMNLLCGV